MLGNKPRVEMPADEKPIFEKAIDWESSRVLAVEKSERLAWYVAFVAVGVAVLAVTAIAIMMPLKESVPYVIRVDNATGVPDIVTAITDKAVTGDEVMDKYWLAKWPSGSEATISDI